VSEKTNQEDNLVVKDDDSHGLGGAPQEDITQTLPIIKPASNKKKWALIAAMLIAAIITAGGLWYWLGVVNAPKSNDDDLAQVQTAKEQSLTAVSSVTSNLAGENIAAPSSLAFGGQTESGQLVYEFAAYQVSGKQFSNLPKEGAGTAYTSSAAEAEANVAKIDKNLKAQGFKPASTSNDDAGAIALQDGLKLVSYATYLSDKTVCALSRLGADGVDQQLTGLGCASIADYAAVAQKLGSIHEAYVKGRQAPEASKLVYSLPEIKDGTGGEKRATLYQKDATKLADTGIYYYYTVENGKEWKFLAAAPKATLDCTVFSTPEIREAFKGIKCYENSDKVSEIK